MGRVRVVRTALPLIVAAVVPGGGPPAGAQIPAPPLPPPAPPEPPPGSPPQRQPVDENPCIGAQAAQLRCPDFVMRRPYGLYTDRLTKAGSTVLRAGNVIDSVGAGPAELRGRRVSRRFMDARQRIHTRDGGILSIDTNARLEFKFAHQQRYWWKFHDAARFELWRIDSRGRRTVKVRTGPKVSYCLRDLTRTRPQVRRSPRRRVYPACSTNARAQSVILGTSPGWADIYPPAYPEQWIDVTGLRGCFAYVHIADPENGIYESNEDNNEAQAIVRLPFQRDSRRRGCVGEDRGRGFDPRGDYYSPPG
jgi:Lysyl oxidase